MSDAAEYSNSPIFDTLIDILVWDRLMPAKAEAWDEGFSAGESDVWTHQATGNWNSECIQNPYRRDW